MRRAVFLDRDGVLNRMIVHPDFGTVDSAANPEEIAVYPFVGEALRQLHQLDFALVVVTNQPGVAKGRFTTALLDAMHDKLRNEIARQGGGVDAIYCCLHHPQGKVEAYRVACDCRKPRPGLLLRAAEELDLDLARSYMVGDGVTDVAAGKTAGTSTIFVSARKCYTCDALAEEGVWPDYMVANLAEAASVIRTLETEGRDAVARFVPRCKLA
jgi:D-glycero-D-manno-heptose 1,7-bisphosphate phosphatase